MADLDLALIAKALGRETPTSSDFDLNPDLVLPENRKLRPAAVLVGILPGKTGPEVLLTKRSS